jgi:sulfopyruvate decarboxylase TPP-binding subunit
MGQLTPNLLDLLLIKKFIIDSTKTIKQVEFAVDFSNRSLESVGILLKRSLWGEI